MLPSLLLMLVNKTFKVLVITDVAVEFTLSSPLVVEEESLDLLMLFFS